MYYEDLIDNNFDDESSVGIRLKLKEQLLAFKKIDKKYEKYTIPFYSNWTDGKYYKQLKIESYGSGSTGTFIRNAVTGINYDIKVGSEDEIKLFKVTDSTGYNKRKEPLILYYDSPEQYEKHYFTNVSELIKKKWLENSIVYSKK